MATQVNLVVDQGTSFITIVPIKNEDGSAFDLTGLSARSQMRKSYYTKTSIDITAEIEGDPLDGNIKLSIPPSVSEGIRAGRYVYDVEVHDASGDYVKRVMQGIVTVSPQVTKTALT